jgi:hypothetical protein
VHLGESAGTTPSLTSARAFAGFDVDILHHRRAWWQDPATYRDFGYFIID